MCLLTTCCRKSSHGKKYHLQIHPLLAPLNKAGPQGCPPKFPLVHQHSSLNHKSFSWCLSLHISRQINELSQQSDRVIYNQFALPFIACPQSWEFGTETGPLDWFCTLAKRNFIDGSSSSLSSLFISSWSVMYISLYVSVTTQKEFTLKIKLKPASTGVQDPIKSYI